MISRRNELGKKVLWAVALWIAAALMAAGTVRADIFTWQDAEGVIHFSNGDAPPQADVYMKEPAPSPPEVQPQDRPGHGKKVESEVSRRERERTEARLEEANRKLNRALEKVDELAERVSDSQARAAAAAEAADQAAIAAEGQADAAAHYQQQTVNDRVIVYSSPYPHRYGKHDYKHRRPYYPGYNKKPYGHPRQDRFRKHYPKFRDKYKRDRDHRRHIGKHKKRIIPYRYDIHKYYGPKDRMHNGRGSRFK